VLERSGEAGRSGVETCTQDKEVSTLLLLHGLHPHPLEQCVLKALEGVRGEFMTLMPGAALVYQAPILHRAAMCVSARSKRGRGCTFLTPQSLPNGNKRNEQLSREPNAPRLTHDPGSVSLIPSKAPILIVEDDRKTADLLRVYLAREGFTTVAAHRGREALELFARHKPMFTILDVMLPDLDGWDICRRLRKSSSVPILILTALGEAHDRVKGLTLGADDYVVKPFSFAELVARVKAILRRAKAPPAVEALSHGGLTVDREKHRVTLGERGVSVTAFEFRLLQTLMASPGRVFTREELLTSLYPTGGVVVDRVIDVHVGKLRQKIEDDTANPRYILTTRGLGYRFADNEWSAHASTAVA